MVAPIRLAALLTGLSLGGTAVAQPPVAPPPHPPLIEVVAEYKRLGLPFPPPDAELVRVVWREYTGTYYGDRNELGYSPAYRIPPKKPGERPRYLITTFRGVGFSEIEYLEAGAVEKAEPTPDLLWPVYDEVGNFFLALAVQCKVRGWDELADAAYLRAREQLVDTESYSSVVGELRLMAWLHWHQPLGVPGGDRKESLQRLTALLKEEPSLRTPEIKEFLRRVELTIAPRNSKPGSVEALIDELTEYFTENANGAFTGWEPPVNPASYVKLTELGFDAVPALIAHITDDRLTRSSGSGLQFGSGYNVTVGHLCSRLLFDLSGRTIGGNYWEFRGDRLDPAEAKKWFEQAKKVGEEKWLLDHAIPADGGKPIVNEARRPEPHIVRVIGAKYPARLPDVYRAMLKVPAESLIGDFVPEVVASKLPQEPKVTLLEEGAAHERLDHRIVALRGLVKLDQVALRKHLLTTLKRIEGQGQKANLDGDIASTLCQLVDRAGDRACWDALLAATKAVDVENRLALIGEVVPRRLPDPKDPQRRERIRFLLQFLDDRTADAGEVGPGIIEVTEVRDYAASQLAGVLDFPVRRTPFFQPVHDATLGVFSRLWHREAIRQAATRELASGN